MKRSLRILMALLGFAVLGATPKAAQVVDQINMTVPFQFVISGKTLPAGTYRINRVWNDKTDALVITNTENNASATVLPTEVASTAAHKPQVSFETAGGEHFLTRSRPPTTYSPSQCRVRRFYWLRENLTAAGLQEVLTEITKITFPLIPNIREHGRLVEGRPISDSMRQLFLGMGASSC